MAQSKLDEKIEYLSQQLEKEIKDRRELEKKLAETRSRFDDARKEISTEIYKKLGGTLIATVVSVFSLAALGAWTLLKPQLISGLEIMPQTQIETLVDSKLDDHSLISNETFVSDISMNAAVVSFALSECPEPWKLYGPAQGRFIRGIDQTNSNDDFRIAGDIQEDALQGHHHNMEGSGAPGLWDSNQGTGREARGAITNYENRQTFQVLGPTEGTNGEVRIANETRPKNVSLLYCIRE